MRKSGNLKLKKSFGGTRNGNENLPLLSLKDIDRSMVTFESLKSLLFLYYKLAVTIVIFERNHFFSMFSFETHLFFFIHGWLLCIRVSMLRYIRTIHDLFKGTAILWNHMRSRIAKSQHFVSFHFIYKNKYLWILYVL